jgi:hypothetical protein
MASLVLIHGEHKVNTNLVGFFLCKVSTSEKDTDDLAIKGNALNKQLVKY